MPNGGRRTDIEDEATTVWGKADLFDGVETEEEDDDLFGESGDSGNRDMASHDDPVTGPGRRHGALFSSPRPHAAEPPPEDHAATVEMTAARAAQLVASAEAEARAQAQQVEADDDTLPPPSGEFSAPRGLADRAVTSEPLVEVSGEERLAAQAEAEARALELEADPTRVVKPTPALSHECRMCGKKIMAPAPRRFRGGKSSVRGFRCDRCGNTFCAAHVVRINGFFSSLFGQGVFRCQLCDLDR